jgi:dynein heavy chain 1
MGCDAEGKPTGFTIKQCYQAIEDVFADAKEYSETWKSFQSLWDINLNEVYSKMLGDDISKWNQLLNEVR